MDQTPTHPPIYSIGYGRRKIEDFIAILQHHGIAYLLDVRSRPYSRFNPPFTRSKLDAHLAAAGIRYVFMGDTLGGKPENPECYLPDETGTPSDRPDYARIRRMDFFQAGLRRLRTAWEQGQRVMLMCAESKPEMCHRTRLVAAALVEEGIEVIHIDEHGEALNHEDVLRRLSGGGA